MQKHILRTEHWLVYLFVYLFVQNNLKSYERIWVELSGIMSNGTRDKLFSLGRDPDHPVKIVLGMD